MIGVRILFHCSLSPVQSWIFVTRLHCESMFEENELLINIGYI
jgi:hypothetical protein